MVVAARTRIVTADMEERKPPSRHFELPSEGLGDQLDKGREGEVERRRKSCVLVWAGGWTVCQPLK